MSGESSLVGDGLLYHWWWCTLAASIVPHQWRYITIKWLRLGEVAATDQTRKYLKLAVKWQFCKVQVHDGSLLTAKGLKRQFAQHTQQKTHSMGLWLWVAAQFAIVPLKFTWQWTGDTTTISEMFCACDVSTKHNNQPRTHTINSRWNVRVSSGYSGQRFNNWISSHRAMEF
jgi:hypothetical protein